MSVAPEKVSSQQRAARTSDNEEVEVVTLQEVERLTCGLPAEEQPHLAWKVDGQALTRDCEQSLAFRGQIWQLGVRRGTGHCDPCTDLVDGVDHGQSGPQLLRERDCCFERLLTSSAMIKEEQRPTEHELRGTLRRQRDRRGSRSRPSHQPK